ncbi:hypothetical protein BOO91_15250 [Vibrio navarrensis]|uniref:Uncharacterized protein n=1 Tax=Vibrio navarrensis TaxID=29495 RepID=A0AAJ4ICB7_9VIBR|nr:MULTISPECIES: hypothetical protein [Vibrio]KJR29298.1 hypothetical protein UF06_11440 [Vibrio sp. S234-5]MBE3662290.1 hypothetical protein [Vibrio navarrensis]MBE4605074.1 hypothetical protein [Vibrio navarrensis]QPL54148.1 hypothetical protein I3X05_03010 [Vibrio navarrensis]
MTRIVPRQEQFRIDYQNEHLPALFSKQASDADFSSALPMLNSEFLSRIISMARLTLMIACEQLKDESLIQAIKEQAEKGIRIYLLLGEKNANKVAIDVLSGRCLIRTGVSQKGALMVVDHTTTQAQGLLLMSGQHLVSADQPVWGIQLERQQIDDSFRSFCKLFWENSNEEYLRQNQQQSSVQHPDGAVVTNHSHQLCGTLNDCLRDTLKQLQAATHSSFSASGDGWRLLLSLQSRDIKNKARTGVALTERPIPSLLLSNDGNWLLPDETDFAAANWCLKLSAQQSQKLEQAYDQAFEEAAWQYKDATLILECADQQLLRFADQPGLEHLVEVVREIELEDINTQDIDSFLNDEAELLASGVTGLQRSHLAHFIDYDVVVHPPYCPQSAKPDALYQAWENAEKDWQQRLEVLTNAQSKIDQQQASIADKLRGFIKGFLLGQGQSVKSLNLEIDTLKNWSVTKATPAERELHRQQLESLQDKIRKRGSDTDQELDKAEQNQRWELQRDNLKAEQMKKSDLSQQVLSALEQLKKNKTEATFQVEQKFRASWISAAERLTDQQLNDIEVNGIQPEQFFAEALPEPQAAPKDAVEPEKQARQEAIQQAKARREELTQQARQACIKARREALQSMDVGQANNWKTSIKEKPWKKHYSAFERCLADHEQGVKKIERDIHEAQKALDNSRTEQERAEKALNEHGSSFVYQPKQASDAFAKQLGLKGNTAVENQFQWPSEELPANGTELRKYQQNRYLVVFDTDQIEQACRDAERLKAQLVCDKESANA